MGQTQGRCLHTPVTSLDEASDENIFQRVSRGVLAGTRIFESDCYWNWNCAFPFVPVIPARSSQRDTTDTVSQNVTQK